MKTVLVTGAAGYLGSVLCPALLAAGHRVIAVDSFRYGAAQATALAACAADPGFELIRADARTPHEFYDQIRLADVVIPLAAIVGAPAVDRDPAAEAINRGAVERLVDYLDPKQLVLFPNTNSAYGSMPDGRNAALDEDAPQAPISGYARQKAMAEAAVLRHKRSVVFRLATVFGASPRMRTDLMVNDFTLRLARDRSLVVYEPNARRNFVHVRDVADAFAWTIKNHYDPVGSAATDRVFNLGNDAENRTKIELARGIADRLGIDPAAAVHVADGADPDRRDYVVSSARLAARGFAARRTIAAGVDELVKLYRGFPDHPWGNV